jgi:hypothetical protein
MTIARNILLKLFETKELTLDELRNLPVANAISYLKRKTIDDLAILDLWKNLLIENKSIIDDDFEEFEKFTQITKKLGHNDILNDFESMYVGIMNKNKSTNKEIAFKALKILKLIKPRRYIALGERYY